MGGGTEAFPDLGRHCQYSDCYQLHFLPFGCNRCQKVFCVEHRTYMSHDCPKSDDKSRKKKPRCPVRRCKENLTFSNATVCKCCNIKVCLKHRLPADHACRRGNSAVSDNGGLGNKFLAAFAARDGKDCAKNNRGQVSATSSSRSVEAC
uniref:AN1-type domain-containing protein n=1 Tax=Chenopodium quinoa TaxID=63459 RepID=A0A803N7V0_CHEQI